MDRGVALVRATLLTALAGHWIANALFDRSQYRGTGVEVLSRLNDPILVQTAIAILGVALLTSWGHRRRRRATPPVFGAMGFAPRAALLVAAQLAFFVVAEATERLAIGGMFEEADVGVFGVGFAAELLVAVGSGLLLAAVGVAARQIVDRLRGWVRASRSAAPAPRPRRSTAPPRPHALAGAGAVRAPPA